MKKNVLILSLILINLFVTQSCKKENNLDNSIKNKIIDYHKWPQNSQKIHDYISSIRIKNYSNKEEFKRKVLLNKAQDINISENDIDQAYNFLRGLNVFDDNLNYQTKITNIINYSYNNGAINDIQTRDFLINLFSNPHNPDMEQEISEFLFENQGLSITDKSLLEEILDSLNNRSQSCDAIGFAIGYGVDRLITVVASFEITPLGAALAGLIADYVFSSVATMICEEIQE